jgi:peptide chain release factor 1
MTQSISDIRARYSELIAKLQSPDIATDPDKLRLISTEQSKLQPIIKLDDELRIVDKNITEAKILLEQSPEPDLKEFLNGELASLSAKKEALVKEINGLLNPVNPEDQGDAIVEIRAAAGGDEAGLFAGDLYRMYLRFAERKGYKVEELDQSLGGIGNIKEVVFKIAGPRIYGLLKFESGVHRVQRVPRTESSGRIHTSTATVAVLPVIEAKDLIINPGDLELEAFRSSGAGGQNVNKVNSAVRLRHKPSGLVVTCQSERSQLQNRERAMEILRSRLWEKQKAAEQSSISSIRNSQIGSGDRAEKIRTYNYPQDRLTDHRLDSSFHNLAQILDGDLEKIIVALQENGANEEKEHPQTAS